MPDAERYWKAKLQEPFVLRHIASIDHWWVEGYCGYAVAEGNTPAEAVTLALARIQEGRGIAVTGQPGG